jgi:hypothetical protein
MPTETFDIIVRGRLSPELVADLNGFGATFCSDGFTHLVGDVADKEQLRGVRQLLHRGGVEVVAARPVGDDVHQHQGGSTPS